MFLNGTCFLPFILPFVIVFYWKDICKAILNSLIEHAPEYIHNSLDFIIMGATVFGLIIIVAAVILDCFIEKMEKHDIKYKIFKIIKSVIMAIGILMFVIAVSVFVLYIQM